MDAAGGLRTAYGDRVLPQQVRYIAVADSCGKVYVNGDLSLSKSRIGTESSDLVVAPAHGRDLHLAPSINDKGDSTQRHDAAGWFYRNNVLEPCAKCSEVQNVSITALNATVDIHGGPT